ncbi:MAG TPA: hypothetical protein VEH31_05470, partial [Streptosporangiaceae bacterium]|nr:hypothetical protein [Streptosporangiaceae bacterium]
MDQHPQGRAGGLRQVRRWSNWTAAALIAATALTTAYFARSAVTAAPSVSVPLGTAGAASRPATGGAPGTGRPCVSVPVA